MNSGVEAGSAVLIEITPAVLFLPKNSACGPRKTSTCSMSK
jgi:hypothetical protein